jgi:DpnII restriction endonuclease
MASADLRTIAGALALFFAGGRGPSRSEIQSALLIAGYDAPTDEGSKQELVQRAVVGADDTTSRRVIEELVSLFRESRYFEFDHSQEAVRRLQRTFSDGRHQLSDDGFVTWGAVSTAFPPPPAPGRSTTAGTAHPPAPVVAQRTGGQQAQGAAQEVASPNLDLLISSLRRLGSGAIKPIVERRRAGRPGFRVDDEYDMQDAVELLLRSLYNDVRQEEPTPSSAGSSSRIDLHLREGRTAVEVKVTAPGRGEGRIKEEILVDMNDYRNHPTVDTLVVVVYDLAHTFDNVAGFEHDLSGMRDGLDVRVVVVPWVGPRAPN